MPKNRLGRKRRRGFPGAPNPSLRTGLTQVNPTGPGVRDGSGVFGRGPAMIPIHELLARIRWDPEFGKGRFELAYLDRPTGALVRVPLERISMTPGAHFSFDAVEADGSVHNVPYHRVREVWRDGTLIWSRREPAGERPR